MPTTEKIGLGTVQFGLKYGISNASGRTPPAEVAEILALCKEKGIAYLDTAAAYGDAEQVLGNCNIDGFKVITKFMPSNTIRLEQQLSQSLEKLQMKSLYGFMAHRPAELVTNPGEWEDLLRLKALGKIVKIGYSLNTPEELKALIAAEMIPDIVQAPYNLFDRRFESHLKELQKGGCEIHTRSSFLQGLFFMQAEKLPAHFNAVKALLQWLQNAHKELLPAALLKFVLQQEFVDTVIIGVENVEQLKENLEKIGSASDIELDIPYIEEEILMPSLWPKLI